jgi:hypothetical protein
LIAAGYSAAGFDPNSDAVSTGSGNAVAAIKEGITGTVTYRSGEPVAGAFVQVSAASAASGPIPDIAILTNRRGNFTLPLRPGTYRLTLLLEGREIASTEAIVTRGHVTELKLQVE